MITKTFQKGREQVTKISNRINTNERQREILKSGQFVWGGGIVLKKDSSNLKISVTAEL
jgi:hypothetical protein